MRLEPFLIALALLAAPLPAGAASCFDGQLPAGVAWAETAAQAAVRLVAAVPDGRPFASASGVIVAGSGAHSGAPNRMLTAAHVVRALTLHRGAWLAVYSSHGVYLGRARLVAQAAPGPAFGLPGGGDAVGLRFGDAATIEMDSFSPGGAQLYTAIVGVPLAPIQPRAMLEGVFTIPAGVDHGVSGAGVVSDGAIVGVMAFKALDPSMPMVSVRAGDAASTSSGDTPRRRTVKLPREATGYATPVIDSALLAGLGAAGQAVGKARATAVADVFVPGFIKSACIGFRGRMHPG